MEHSLLFIGIACVFGLFMTWGVGANDLANVMSTSLGSKAITVKQAMLIAIIFEFAGAFIGGTDITNTMRTGIINFNLLSNYPVTIVLGMIAVLMAGMTWMATASYLGLPVSITNAIVGAVVGFGCVVLGTSAIHWQKVGIIAVSWLSSPFIAGLIAFALFMSIQRLILGKKDPVTYARRYLPMYLFLVSLVLVYITVFKSLQHFHITLSQNHSLELALLSALSLTCLAQLGIRRLGKPQGEHRHYQFAFVEKKFSILMALTACAMVFAHGANDVSVAIGPITVVLELITQPSQVLQEKELLWITLLGVSGVILGLLMYGHKVIATVGKGITTLTPSSAFAATLAAALAVVCSTSVGIPVSATQTLVGAILGVGLARGIGALDLLVIRNIFLSWIITLPAASLLTIGYYYLLRWIFGN